MKKILNAWNQFFAMRQPLTLACTAEMDATVREILNRELRRNLAAGMSLRDAVYDTRALIEAKSNDRTVRGLTS
jgi:hypothetical protein